MKRVVVVVSARLLMTLATAVAAMDSDNNATAAVAVAEPDSIGPGGDLPPPPSVPEWPPMMLKIGGIIEEFPNSIPVTTAQARALGWVKADDEGERCNTFLGEPWMYGGERSVDSSATLYFTPEIVTDIEPDAMAPGIVSGIEVDYYGHFEESLVGTYFSPERVNNAGGGTYHSISLALRDYDEHDLCDTTSPIARTHLERVTVAPGMANLTIPLHENSMELRTNWREGSCIRSMGYHWIRDIVGGPNLTYEASNLVPVVPMYGSSNGDLQGVIFVATDQKQTWPADCVPHGGVDCPAPSLLNFWDRSPGLTAVNAPPFYMCSNFCDKGCQFKGSPDGMYTTMHWMFGNTFMMEDCGGAPVSITCRNNEHVEFAPPTEPSTPMLPKAQESSAATATAAWLSWSWCAGASLLAMAVVVVTHGE